MSSISDSKKPETKKENGKMVSLTVDGKPLQVPVGTTIWEAAREAGIEIPVLCHSPRMEPVGVCRICVVEIGERVLAASCVRKCEEGMTVQSTSPELEKHRAMLTTLLLSDYPERSAREESTGDDELLALARAQGIAEIPFAEGDGLAGARREDLSSHVIAVDHQACILCDRCIRACDDLQHNDVIGRTGKGHGTRIAFDLDNPMGESSCVACGECMASCPTGALTDKGLAGVKVIVT